MVIERFELGPELYAPAPDFVLPNYDREAVALAELMGDHGLLLGFIGDIWHAKSVRRILWLQHHVPKFAMMGVPSALLVRDEPGTLYGFHHSSPTPVPFPLLADEDGAVHQAYRMDRQPGLLLLDTAFTLQHMWLMPDERVWPRPNEIVRAIHDM